jgi:hypothetical protein
MMIVFAAGVWTMVSIIVTSPCGDPFADVAAAGPPSTGTTEYVALRTNGSSHTAFRGRNGSDEPRKKSEDTANSAADEVLIRIMKVFGEKTGCQDRQLRECGLIIDYKERNLPGYREAHDILTFPMEMGGWDL